MSAQESKSEASPIRGGRGRGKSRGGLGKYLRARGRGRGGGRPAEFGKRMVLEHEEVVELDVDSEEAKELRLKYSRRQLGSNADRYAEPEPELDSGGEEILEPEVDLSSFLERQRLSPSVSSPSPAEDDDEVDESLAHLPTRASATSQSKKGRTQQIEWDDQLDKMIREKAAADATRDLKTRFREKTDKIRNRPVVQGQGSGLQRKQGKGYIDAPPLPTDLKEKNPKDEMQDFLDDLLG